ncbi:MAG: GIY-YIG nuclease family protein [Ignavibacteriaceae bacterium]|nr:GIY-YIG nuclease family protein [Ignavibacteriaceae bacterium]
MIDKKKLKQEYLLTPKPAGVFKIENKLNGKIFLSGSLNLDKIFNRHSFQLKQNVHADKGLQTDWNEQGEENFSFEIVKQIKIKDDPSFNLKKEVEKLLENTIQNVPIEKRYNDK